MAGDEIPVKLKVNDSSAGIPGEWDVDESNAGSLVLLRRTLFKYKGVTDRMDFVNEPYICGEHVEGAASLLRASWTSKRYLGYAGRTVRMEYRLTDGAGQRLGQPVPLQRPNRRQWLCRVNRFPRWRRGGARRGAA